MAAFFKGLLIFCGSLILLSGIMTIVAEKTDDKYIHMASESTQTAQYDRAHSEDPYDLDLHENVECPDTWDDWDDQDDWDDWDDQDDWDDLEDWEEPTTRIPVQEPSTVTDARIPHYVEPEAVTWIPKEYIWTSPNTQYEMTYTTSLEREMYEYYHALPRYTSFSDYKYYLDDENNREILKGIADAFTEYQQEHDYSDYEIVQEVITFVQSIKYVNDRDSTGQDEFQKYPLETLYSENGDCEDSALLLAGILRELGYGTCLLHLPHHVAVGIMGDDSLEGSYYDYDGEKFFYIEPTNTGWSIGEIPKDFKEEEATILYIN